MGIPLYRCAKIACACRISDVTSMGAPVYRDADITCRSRSMNTDKDVKDRAVHANNTSNYYSFTTRQHHSLINVNNATTTSSQLPTNIAATNHATHSGVQDSASGVWASLNTTLPQEDNRFNIASHQTANTTATNHTTHIVERYQQQKYTTTTNHTKQPQLQQRKAHVHVELGESRGAGVNGPGSSWGLEALVPATQRSKKDVILNLMLKKELKDTKERPGRDVVTEIKSRCGRRATVEWKWPKL
jgi:hypothetical protein